jgi:hypothetical protein
LARRPRVRLTGARRRRAQVDAGHANAAAVAVAALLEGAGDAPPDCLRLGTLLHGGAWLGVTQLRIKVRGPAAGAGAAVSGREADTAPSRPLGAAVAPSRRTHGPRRAARLPTATSPTA